MKNHSISKEFFNKFTDSEESEKGKGIFNDLLEYVLEDDTLCLELRGDIVNIYYRGGSLYKISDKDNKISFDTNYCENKELDPNPKVEDAVRLIPYYKRAMDKYFSEHPKNEREFQQLILRENNNNGIISRATDYFIVDIEFQDDENHSRFDMAAFKWPSKSASRKKTDNLGLSLIEFKYGDGAIDGKSGIIKHFEDFISFVEKTDNFNNFKRDMENVFKQKYMLGLVKGLKRKEENEENEENEKLPEIDVKLSNELELIFIFANHDPEKTKLKKALQDILSYTNEPDVSSRIEKLENKFKIFVAQSSFMGYGLFVENMVELKDFVNKL